MERKRNVSVEFRVFGKKKWKLKEKFQGKKMFLGESLKCKILLSLCSLIGLYVNLQVKVTENLMRIFKVFFGPVLKLKLRFAEKGKVKITVGNKMIVGVGLEPNHVWAPCCKTWLKFEGKFTIVERKGKEIGDFNYWVRTHWLGAML